MSASLWQTPLGEFQSEVAAAQPAQAGVATACVAAALGLSLLAKALRITGKCPAALDPAAALIEELRQCADADVEAVRAYIQTREARAMRDVPARAARAMQDALNLCAEASGMVKGLVAADVEAAAHLVSGALQATRSCQAANGPNTPTTVS